MLLRQERGGWVEDPLEDIADPDVVSLSLAKLCGWTGTIFDALWPVAIQFDAKEIREARQMQMMQLSRYGRLDYFKLQDADVIWIREQYEILVEVMKLESDAGTAVENE